MIRRSRKGGAQKTDRDHLPARVPHGCRALGRCEPGFFRGYSMHRVRYHPSGPPPTRAGTRVRWPTPPRWAESVHPMVTETRRVAPRPDTTPASDSSGWRGPLPEDVLQATAHRLVLFCGVAAASWTAAVAVENVLKRPGAATPFPWPGNLIAGVVVALLLATRALIKMRAVDRPRPRPRRGQRRRHRPPEYVAASS
jgi:hypothetical protein